MSSAATTASAQLALTGAGLAGAGLGLRDRESTEQFGEFGLFAASAHRGGNILSCIPGEDLGDASAGIATILIDWHGNSGKAMNQR